MKLASLLLVLLVTGCVATPVARNFPAQPETTREGCAELTTVAEGTTQLSAVLGTVLENYGKYHECKIKAETWQEWYTKQKEIFDSVK
jgi:hypothetical protein